MQWLGVSERSLATRLELLCAEKDSARVLRELSGLNAAEMAHIDTLAKLNAEQADAAFRRALIFNLTLPVSLIAGLAQIDPTLFAGAHAKLAVASPRLVVIAAAMALLIASTVFAFLRSRDARSLADLVAIAKAKCDRAA
jgi:hypothetical protein